MTRKQQRMKSLQELIEESRINVLADSLKWGYENCVSYRKNGYYKGCIALTGGCSMMRNNKPCIFFKKREGRVANESDT